MLSNLVLIILVLSLVLSFSLSDTHILGPISSLLHHSVIASFSHLRSVFANANKHKLPRVVPAHLYADSTLTNLHSPNLTPSVAEHTQSSAASLGENGQVLQCVCDGERDRDFWFFACFGSINCIQKQTYLQCHVPVCVY